MFTYLVSDLLRIILKIICFQSNPILLSQCSSHAKNRCTASSLGVWWIGRLLSRERGFKFPYFYEIMSLEKKGVRECAEKGV